jgi:hypothetical protein
MFPMSELPVDPLPSKPQSRSMCAIFRRHPNALASRLPPVTILLNRAVRARHYISTLLIVQDYREKRVVDFDFAVIFNEAQLPELVHEHIHARARRTDHFR